MMQTETWIICPHCTKEFKDRSRVYMHILNAHGKKKAKDYGEYIKVPYKSEAENLIDHIYKIDI